MATYRVTVVRMVEGTAIVEAGNPYEAKLLAGKGHWFYIDNTFELGAIEVVGEPELINEGEK